MSTTMQAAHPRQKSNVIGSATEALTGAAIPFLRYALILILLYFGAFKFTAVEAEMIRPMVENSPFFSWMYSLLSVRAVSNLIGVTEIAVALLLAARPLAPRAAGYAGLAAAAIFAATLSFMVTTPGMWGAVPGFPLPLPSAMGSFVIKDIFLLGAALAVAGEALAAARARATDISVSR
jgi:uncharacterized membrane protein YkgB